jgi:hypothetical protein
MLMTEVNTHFKPTRRQNNLHSTAKSPFLEANKKSIKRVFEDEHNVKSNLYAENASIAEYTNFENYQRFIKSKGDRKNVNITLPSIDFKTKLELLFTN